MQQIAAYEFVTAVGRFAINRRPYHRWRVSCAVGLLDQSFESPQQALAELASRWPVPPDLKDWTSLLEHNGDTMMIGVDQLES